MTTSTSPGTSSGLVAFGWDYDHGEFVVLNGQVPQPAREAIYQAGFSRRGETLDCWHQRRSVEPHEQIRRAGRLVDQLVAARVPVANWHHPEQRNGDLSEHYWWLQDEGPFPDADRATEAAWQVVCADLATDRLVHADRGLARAVLSGALVVEAMQTFDDVDWWLARDAGDPDSSSYVMLRHDTGNGFLGVTDHWATGYGPQARRDFRATHLRDTTHPPAARAQAARPSRRARLAAAPSTAPLPPGPDPRRSAAR
ncbi:hypothetical protein [Kitasatospora sp. A2-31]|uniref:hypothetical protein n=1 Tax=Kitasatospora sp. A2-31 TaxID=2916414 RepID=UPI001EECAB03|nr:hypothetical protein [Kitasatospora sp. A2-31]MCG6497093.1 hypothetical protein [Kitasatospora sp. A2-31]